MGQEEFKECHSWYLPVTMVNMLSLSKLIEHYNWLINALGIGM